MNLIFIHGIGEQKEKYSLKLFNNIASFYGKKTEIRHCEILWDDVLEDLIKRYKEYEYGPKKTSIWGKLVTRKMDPLALQVMYYLKDKGDKNTGEMNILKRIHEEFEKIHKYGNKDDIIVAHSLGSVIAFDYVFGFRKQYKYSEQANLRALVTLGSPIPMFTAAMGYVESDLELPQNVKKWVNILDKDDGVARFCKPFFKNINIKERRVATSVWPIKAHTNYWKKKSVARIIAKEINK